MSYITKPIGKQVFEIIHDRIGGILKEELQTQYALSYDPDFDDIPVYKERDIPYNAGELTDKVSLNVMFDRGEYDELQTSQQQTGMYRYVVEVVGQAPSEGNTLGDQISMTRVQKILGKCRAIIMSPHYLTLGFPRPSIGHRRVENMFFGKPPVRQDAIHTVMGRMTILVRATETVDFIDTTLCKGTTARVYLYLTDRGYQWSSQYGDVFDEFFDFTYN